LRYLTYQLNFPTPDYGYGPEDAARAAGSTLVASAFVAADATHLGYLTGDLDPAMLADWSAVELTQNAALVFAQALNAEAHLLEDGTITAPGPEEV
jgi:hypothetical protein